MHFLILTTSFLLTYSLINYLNPLFRKYFLDKPNLRSSHISPTPKAGGIVISLISSIYYFVTGSSLIIICLPISILGLLDDYFNLSPILRYFFQLVFSSYIIWQSNSSFLFEIKGISYIVLFLIFVFISTIFINLTNFMDGLDGLIGGCMLISFICVMNSSNLQLTPVIGSLLAFLIFNWPPAKIFMGDSGSTFLGILYFYCAFSSESVEKFFGYTIINLPIYADAVICIIRRFLSGQNIFKPHKLHLYQRLHSAGWSKQKISSIYILLTFLLAIVYLKSDLNFLLVTSIFTLVLGCYIDSKFASPFDN